MSREVSWLRRPRVWTVTNEPGPPSCCTRRPGTVRSASVSVGSSRSSISSRPTTVTAFETSSTVCGASEAVTMTSALRPATSREMSNDAAPPRATETSRAAAGANPSAAASTRYAPGASRSKRYAPEGSVSVESRTSLRSRAWSVTTAPTSAAPCGSVTRPASVAPVCAAPGGAGQTTAQANSNRQTRARRAAVSLLIPVHPFAAAGRGGRRRGTEQTSVSGETPFAATKRKSPRSSTWEDRGLCRMEQQRGLAASGLTRNQKPRPPGRPRRPARPTPLALSRG
jgi:hypothetical protein